MTAYTNLTFGGQRYDLIDLRNHTVDSLTIEDATVTRLKANPTLARSVRLTHVNLPHADFTNATLDTAIIDTADAQGSTWRNATIPHATFRHSNLTGTIMTGTRADQTLFYMCQTQKLYAPSSTMSFARFAMCDLRDATLTGNLAGTVIECSRLDNTTFPTEDHLVTGLTLRACMQGGRVLPTITVTTVTQLKHALGL